MHIADIGPLKVNDVPKYSQRLCNSLLLVVCSLCTNFRK